MTGTDKAAAKTVKQTECGGISGKGGASGGPQSR
mgnify:CR=1 FL=1